MFTKKRKFFSNPIKSKARLVTLTGMMGTGKSKFGSLVARQLKINFYDTDKLIEEQIGISIQKIFEEFGENFFRKIEEEKINTIVNNALISKTNSIISIGGGAFDNLNTRQLLLKKTKVIWLDTPTDILVKRIGNGSKRPMIKGDVKKTITKILNKRIEYYSLSHQRLKTENLNKTEVISAIKSLIQL